MKPSSGRTSIAKVVTVVLGFTSLILVGWLMLDILDTFGGTENVWRHFGFAALPALLPIFAAPSIPGEVAGLATISIYGPMLGTPLAWLGLIMRAVIEYALARQLGDLSEVRDLVRLPRWLARLPAQHPFFLIAGRWMPLGNHIVSVVAGARRVALWRFVWTASLGLAPFTLLLCAASVGLIAAHA